MIEAIFQDFHFLRPEWFYAIIPAALLFALLRYRQSSTSNWDKAIAPELLHHLLETPSGTVSKNPFSLILMAWLIATFALAGPVWEKKPQPVHEREDALVIIFDLTRSMYATDVRPNRLVRARRKLKDLLGMREEGVTGLIVFAGDAHAVSPLTDDTNTIIAMIPALTPQIMPAPGSELASAIVRAIQLFHDAGVTSGRILIITDEIRDVAEAQAVARNYRYSFPVSVLSVGTAEGAPIPIDSFGNAGYLKDRAGNLVIPKVDAQSLQDFANLAGGRFSAMTLADEDLAYLLADDPLLQNDTFRVLERDFDVWFEQGPWLLLLLLPLASLAFRRGWIWGLALLLLLPPEPAVAGLWDDLWQTRDQQAMTALDNGEANKAARLFEHSGWKGSAFYKGENFTNAGNQFATIDSSDARYNLGNSLAKQARFEEAIEAYTQSLEIQPDHEDATFNKRLIEELLSQQQQQQQQSEDGEQNESPDQEQGDQQSQNEQDDSQDDQQASNEQHEQQQGKKEEEQEQSQEQSEEQDAEPQNQQMAEQDAKLDAEEQQALQQWLRRVPDDPGGLLRRKFEQQYKDNLRQGNISRNDSNADW